MTQAPQITSSSWLMVALLGLVWGATFLFIDIALFGITPFWLAAYRIVFAALLTGLVWAATGARFFLSKARNWPGVILVGLLSSAIPFMLLSWGQQHVTSGFAGVSMAAVALMVLPLAHYLIPEERLTWRRGLGFVIGFIGVLILMGEAGLSTTGASHEQWGRAACLAAAACYALSSIAMRRLPPMDAIGLAAVPLVIGSAFVVPLAWAVEGPPPMPDRQTLLVLLVLGLLPTAGANLLRVLVIRSAGPVFMSLTNYQVPLWSVAFGMIFLGEPFRLALLLALMLILCGVALSQWGALSRLFRPVFNYPSSKPK